MRLDVKTIFALVIAVTLASGCATAPSGAARASDPATLTGTWNGSFSGSEMATAVGPTDAPARLTITQDGRWTLTSSGGTVATGVSHRVGNKLVLDGTMTAGDPMGVGRAVSYVLQPRGASAMFGDGQTFFLGHRIDAGVSLRKVS